MQEQETVPNTSGSLATAPTSGQFAAGMPWLILAPHNSRCTGTMMNDYLRCSDLSHLPEELVS